MAKKDKEPGCAPIQTVNNGKGPKRAKPDQGSPTAYPASAVAVASTKSASGPVPEPVGNEAAPSSIRKVSSQSAGREMAAGGDKIKFSILRTGTATAAR